MIRIATAAMATLIAVGVAPSFAATTADAPFTVAQGLDVHIGGGDRDMRDRDRDRDMRGDRDMRDRRVIREHRIREHDRDCRTVVVRRHTPNGIITRRTRTCD